MNSNTSRIRRLCTVGALCAATLLAACSAVQTTGSGAVGVERKQYMSGLVSEAALQQEAAQQYTSLVSKARSQGALDVNAAETARVNKIVQRLIQQVGVFRPDAPVELESCTELRRGERMVHARRKNRRLHRPDQANQTQRRGAGGSDRP